MHTHTGFAIAAAIAAPVLPIEPSGELRAAVERWAAQQADKPTITGSCSSPNRGWLRHRLMKRATPTPYLSVKELEPLSRPGSR
jgi:hypothetical protein